MSDDEDFVHPPAKNPAGPSAPKTPNPSPSVELIRFRDFASVIRLPDGDRLTNDNWFDWKEAITNIFVTCNVLPYVNGELKCPDKKTDPIGNQHWIQNDSWVRSVI